MLYRNPILISIWDVGMTHQLHKRDGRYEAGPEGRLRDVDWPDLPFVHRTANRRKNAGSAGSSGATGYDQNAAFGARV